MVSPAPFAKIFPLGDGRQFTAYLQPWGDEPTLVFLTLSGGALATTQMTFANPESELTSRILGLEKILQDMDEEKGRSIADMLDDILRHRAPEIAFVNDLHAIVGHQPLPLSKLVSGPSGEQALLIRETGEDDAPMLKVVTRMGEGSQTFMTSYHRDLTFNSEDPMEWTNPLPEAIRERLGVKAMAPQRRPRGP